MKLIFLLLSVALLVTGLISDNQLVLISGPVLFIIIQSLDLILVYRASKLYRADTSQTEIQNKRNFVNILSKWLDGIITFLGLIIMVVGSDGKDELFVAGAIIWIGVIVIYFLGGVIVQYITGISLRFGYGGWYVYHGRRKKS